MKFLQTIVLVATTALITGCATTTPYQAASKPGGFDGYSQTMIENDRARVTFGGNSLTDRDTVENYLLYRAAELTSERGFDYFTLSQRDTEAKTRIQSSPNFGTFDPYFHYSFYSPRAGWSPYHRFSYFGDPFFRHNFRRGSAFYFGGRYDPYFDDFNVREITKYRASAEVKFGRGPVPDQDNAFSAQEVLTNLAPAIVYPEEQT